MKVCSFASPPAPPTPAQKDGINQHHFKRLQARANTGRSSDQHTLLCQECQSTFARRAYLPEKKEPTGCIMPCKTCGQGKVWCAPETLHTAFNALSMFAFPSFLLVDCKCLRMMSKRSCGTRSCDSGCTCSCNTATPCRSTGAQPGPDGQPEGAAGRQRSEGGQTGCCCATADGGEDGASAGCGDACTC